MKMRMENFKAIQLQQVKTKINKIYRKFNNGYRISRNPLTYVK